MISGKSACKVNQVGRLTGKGILFLLADWNLYRNSKFNIRFSLGSEKISTGSTYFKMKSIDRTQTAFCLIAPKIMRDQRFNIQA